LGLPVKSFEPFRLDEVNQCLWRGDTRLSLTPKPFAVLRYLVNHPGRLVTHEELLNAIWPDTYVQPEVLRRYILEIRRVLADSAENPRFVETLPKRGYQFLAAVIEDAVDATSQEVVAATMKLVGRQSALSDLNSYLRAALDGHRQLVFVGGEAGIGKTSVVDAFQQAARMNGVCVARGQSVEGFGGKEPYYPIFETLGQLAKGVAAKDFVETLKSQAPTWLIQFPSLINSEKLAALERELAGATRERMVRELCEALESFTATTGLVIILEDLHWADRSTLDLISAIARRREMARLLVIGTFRPADLILSDSPLKSLKQDLLVHHLSHELSLERLEEADIAQYLAIEFANGDLPAGLAGIIHRHSDGNPLFMTAMLDHLVKQKVLSGVDGLWTMTIPLEQVDPGVPDTLRQMLEVQLGHLSDDQQRLLKCASVSGEHFSAWAVATMLETPLSDAEEQCALLAKRQQFLKASGTREFPNGLISSTYEFGHSLYREVLYRQLTSVQRVSFHRRLANGIEDVCTTGATDAAAMLALHFEEGHEYERAIEYLVLAAENATRRYAHRESITALQHGRELLAKIKEERRAEFDVQILEKIGDAYYALGEFERSAATYHALATRAAEAGLLTTQANALMRLAHSAEAIPFFLKAVELDPDFASAYVSLSRIYSNLNEVERAKEYAKLAYERKDLVSERERLSIMYQYEFEVTGNQSAASQTLEVWKYAFPEEFQPPNSLSYIYNLLGDFARAVNEGKDAVSRNADHGFPYSNLAHAYRGLGDFDQARKTAEQAVQKNIETLPTRRLLYQLALLAGDREEAARNLERGRDRPREFEIVGARAQVAAYAGKVREARELYEQTAQMAESRNLPDVGSNHLAWATWMELVYGNYDRAKEEAYRVLARSPGYDPQLRAVLTLALTGSPGEAETIAGDLSNKNPEHTIINSILAPMVWAAIELSRHQPEQALEQLAIVAPYELGFVAALAPVHLRAHVYSMLGSLSEAIVEYQRIIEHRGSDPFSAFYPAALVGLARAHFTTGNTAASLDFYEQFLTNWSDADSDTPLLIAARQEYDRIKSGSTRLAPKRIHARA
jgi:DNA-binding winged helix-turn-helix (wHTH) protein/tetratricopeptide (TPR) repeat protein